MKVNNPPKMIGILVAIVCLTTLLLFRRISESGGVGLLGLIVGYLVGNGVAAKRGDPVEPTIGASDGGQART